MQKGIQSPHKDQPLQVSNSRALFLTQQNTYSPLRKKVSVVKYQPEEEQKDELWQMNRLCDNLLQQVNEIKTQEVLSLYRQLNRNMSQSLVEKEGQINKLQKVSKIDIAFLRKTLENQPRIDYNYLNQRIQAFKKEADQVNNVLLGYEEKVLNIQKQFW